MRGVVYIGMVTVVLLSGCRDDGACFPGVVFFDLGEAEEGTHTVSAQAGGDQGGTCTVYGAADPPVLPHHISYVAYTSG